MELGAKVVGIWRCRHDERAWKEGSRVRQVGLA
jgi:hypothetical protein